MTGIRELSKRILFVTGYVFSFIFEYGTFVGKEPGRDAIRGKDLKSDMIIGIEGLLLIEESTDDLSGRIINGEMKMRGLLAKISAEEPVGMDLGSVQCLKLVDRISDILF